MDVRGIDLVQRTVARLAQGAPVAQPISRKGIAGRAGAVQNLGVHVRDRGCGLCADGSNANGGKDSEYGNRADSVLLWFEISHERLISLQAIKSVWRARMRARSADYRTSGKRPIKPVERPEATGRSSLSIGILGGGLAGLTIAAHLDQDCEVLERESRGGGHCQTVQECGFTYDAGGPHIIFSRDQQMVDYMVSLLEGNVHQARRSNKIFYKGRYVKYPFENGLFDLEPQDRFECLYHYIRNDYPPPQTNFKEWLYHHFGKGLAEKYLIPYNEKIWNVPAEELGLEWVDGRVPKPPLEDVIKAAVGVETEGYTHQLYFHYPAHGGIESLPRAMGVAGSQHRAGLRG